MSMKPDAIIYTDGSCLGNPGPGGWGAVIRIGDDIKEMSGGAPRTTNNRMELTGVITALNSLRGPHLVTLFTDSQYIVRAFNERWIYGWKKRGWAKADGELKNKDLWQELYALTQKHTVTWMWVKGHNGNEYNERCDKLAVAAAKKFSSDDTTPDFTYGGHDTSEDDEDAKSPVVQGRPQEPKPTEHVAEQATLWDAPKEPEPVKQAPTQTDSTIMAAFGQFMQESSAKINGTPFPCGGEPWCVFCKEKSPDDEYTGCRCVAAYMEYRKEETNAGVE